MLVVIQFLDLISVCECKYISIEPTIQLIGGSIWGPILVLAQIFKFKCLELVVSNGFLIPKFLQRCANFGQNNSCSSMNQDRI